MAKRCAICGHQTIFFRWSSTRGFPVLKMLKKMGQVSDYKKQRLSTKRVGVPICVYCCDELYKEE
jgi:hypothetical protein